MIGRGGRSRYLRALQIPEWVLRTPPGGEPAGADDPAQALAAVEASAPGAPESTARVAGSVAPDAETWARLRSEVAACTACPLHATRTQTVFGVGAADAALMVIGEAPGADEDRQGEPFVGRAGRLLNAMLRGIGLARDDVFIANILKCRPPQNRDPRPEESSTCTPFLDRQIALVAPRAILAVGRISAQWLLQSDTPIGRLRGGSHRYGESQTPVVVTYHPAYLLRSPLAKAKAWEDLLRVRELLSGSDERRDRT